MAFKSLTIPAIATNYIPINISSTTHSSPITPLSELSGSSGPKYCIYPSATTPTRELTPPPTSRFAPFFKNMSSGSEQEDFAAAGSFPMQSRSNSLDQSPFSPTISRPVPSSLSFAPRSSYVDPGPRSAPLRASNPSPWQNPTRAAEHIEKLNDVIQGLRHQLTLKSFDLDTAEAELARVSEAYALLIKEKAMITQKYIRAQQHAEELDLKVHADERYIVSQVSSRSKFAYQKAKLSQDADDLRQWSEFHNGHFDAREQHLQLWEDRLKANDLVSLRRPSLPETEGASSAVSQEEPKAIKEPSLDAVKTVLTAAAALPTFDQTRLDPKFLRPSFNFASWANTTGLQLPATMQLLAPLGWNERLQMDEANLTKLGVTDPQDRTYILRVLSAISGGEVVSISSETCTANANANVLSNRIHASIPHLRPTISRTITISLSCANNESTNMFLTSPESLGPNDSS